MGKVNCYERDLSKFIRNNAEWLTVRQLDQVGKTADLNGDNKPEAVFEFQDDNYTLKTDYRCEGKRPEYRYRELRFTDRSGDFTVQPDQVSIVVTQSVSVKKGGAIALKDGNYMVDKISARSYDDEVPQLKFHLRENSDAETKTLTLADLREALVE